MDPYTPAAPVTPGSTVEKRDWRPIAIAVAAIVAVVIVGYLLWARNSGPLAESERIVIASDSLPLAAASVVDARTGSLAPLTAEGQGTAVVVDSASTPTAHYFLISDPTFRSVNLYTQSRENPGAGLSQVTYSSGVKFDLSFDAPSGSAAYVAVRSSNAPAHVYVWRNGEEKDMGEGSHPVLLSGGFFVLYQKGTELMTVNTESGKSSTVLNIAEGAPFAADPEKLVIALYEPATKAIQLYSIAGMVSASYQSSAPAPYVPAELAYASGTLVIVSIDEATQSVLLHDGGKPISVAGLLEAVRSGNYKLSIHHE